MTLTAEKARAMADNVNGCDGNKFNRIMRLVESRIRDEAKLGLFKIDAKDVFRTLDAPAALKPRIREALQCKGFGCTRIHNKAGAVLNGLCSIHWDEGCESYNTLRVDPSKHDAKRGAVIRAAWELIKASHVCADEAWIHTTKALRDALHAYREYAPFCEWHGTSD